jgi:hypothetical protein
MVRNQKQLLLIQLGIAIIVIILVAGGLSKLHFHSGETLDVLGLLFQNLRPQEAGAPAGSVGGGAMLGLFNIVFWVLLAFTLLYAIVSPRYRKQLLRSLITILALAFILSRVTEFQGGREQASEQPLGSEMLEPAKVSLPEPPPFITNPPGWFLVAVNGFLVLLLLGVMWYFWRRLHKPDKKALLAQEAETALSDLEAGGDLKDVVLRCYASMSQVLRESRNVERAKAMTPREFQSHLAEAGLQDQHIQRLTYLFEGVRYGARPSAGRTELEAMACLRAIVQAYGKTP